MKLRVVAAIAALAVVAAVATAQPLVDQGQPVQNDPRVTSPTTGGAKIPVTMPTDTEVLGSEKTGASIPGTGSGGSGSAQLAVEQPINPDEYICGTGDVFELEFWGQQNFRLKLAVDLEGRAFISKVGFVAVAGKTLTAVRKVIKDKVRANYPGLQFELTLVAPRTFLVHIVANVKLPGIYGAHPTERLSAVLSHAGGSTGSKRRIAIRHLDGTTITADLVLYELTGDTKYNPHLVDGDVVTVPFAEVTATVIGAVHRPGRYELVTTKDVAELLELSGGFTSDLTRSLPLQVISRNADQHEATATIPIPAVGMPNAPLHDEDRVIVPGIDDIRRSVLLIGAVVGAETVDAASTSKRLPFVEGDTVQSLLDRAGGIRAPGDLKRSYISRPQPNGAPSVIPIDLEALLVRRDRRADVAIAMGDTIVIPAMQYSVLVQGAVVRAGLYSYNPLFHVPEYLAHAGGRTRTAVDLDEVRVIDPDGHSHSYKADVTLHPGDAILVPERNWTRAEIVQLIIGGAGVVLSGIAVLYAVQK